MYRIYIAFLGVVTMLSCLLSSCSKEQSYDPDITKIDSSIIAQLSFSASADSIVKGTQVGSFVMGAQEDTSYISVPVIIANSGSYNIKAVVYFDADSLIFAGAGYVSSSDSMIKLYPSDPTFSGWLDSTYTATNITKNSITLNGVYSGYRLNTSVIISSANNSIPNVDSVGTWSFNDGTAHTGIITTATLSAGTITLKADDGTFYHTFSVTAPENNVTTPIILDLNNPSQTMYYPIVNIGYYKDGGSTIDTYFPDNVSTNVFTITQYDTENKIIEGTFSGTFTAKDAIPAQVNITSGSFKAKVQ